MNRIFLLAFGCVALAAASYGQSPGPATTRTAVFAGGCFWCIQPAFDKAPGVIKTVVGYCGGTEPNPTYELVTSEKTKYRESIEITYDPAKISYEQTSRHLLAPNRSHPIRRPVHRYRTELSRRNLLWQRRGKENCRRFKRQTRALRKI